MNCGHTFQVAPWNRVINRILITFWWLKLEVTTFGILEELKAELRLKQLLWESVQEWDSSLNGWRKVRCIYVSGIEDNNIFWFWLWTLPPQSKLQQLDIDQIGSQITKYDKYVDQLEEGLPKNSVVSSLKDKMDVMTHMVGSLYVSSQIF